jgi:predicted dehydrogenase
MPAPLGRRTVQRPIRVGLVGAGSARTWAARAHVPALMALPDAVITAVATTREESAESAARLTGAEHAFTDGRALAEHPDVDVVAVVVKVPAHYDLVSAAVAAGKHVYCEWPLGVDLAQARELCDMATRAGVIHMIGLQGRQSPELLTGRDLIADGLIGRVLSCDMRHSTGHRGGARVTADAVWGLDRKMGRSLLTIQGGHSLDALANTLGARFKGLSALVATRTPRATVVETGRQVRVDTPDQVVIAGELEGEVPAAVHLQGGAPELEGFCIEVHGDRGVLRISGPGAHNSELVLESIIDGAVIRIPPATQYLRISAEELPNPVGNVARQYASLFDQIRTGQLTGPSFVDAVAVHELLQSVQEASDIGRYLSVRKRNESESLGDRA